MSYLAGVLTGVLLTVLVVFLVDNFTVTSSSAGIEPQQIVNWDIAAQKLRSSMVVVEQGAREVRDEVHKATH
jgi:hypothetical protein